MGLFKSSAERRLEKFDIIYWTFLDGQVELWRSQLPGGGYAKKDRDKRPMEDLPESEFRKMSNGAFNKARYEMFGIQAGTPTPDLDPLKENLWGRAKRHYLSKE